MMYEKEDNRNYNNIKVKDNKPYKPKNKDIFKTKDIKIKKIK
jgi:hypothetical protein